MRHHIQLQVVGTGDGGAEVGNVEIVRNRGVEGLTLFSRPIHLNKEQHRNLSGERYPLVLIDGYRPICTRMLGF